MNRKTVLAGLVLSALVFCGTLPAGNRLPPSQRVRCGDPAVFARVDYDQLRQVLTLEFSNGYAYEFRDVPVESGRSFMASSSRGYYFNRFIRGQYASRRLPEAPR